MKKTAAVS